MNANRNVLLLLLSTLLLLLSTLLLSNTAVLRYSNAEAAERRGY